MVQPVPTNEMLADYASGAAGQGLSLLIASHLTYCPESRARLAAMERIGGAVMAAEPAEPLGPEALDRALAEIDAAPAPEPASRPQSMGGPLPRPVLDALDTSFDELRWSFRLPGISAIEVAESEGCSVSLLRARPGAKIPQHTHKGREYTLVLAGALRDGDTVYRPGDIDMADEQDDHRPEVEGDETCYCLIVLDGGLHFTGRFSRALNLFQG